MFVVKAVTHDVVRKLISQLNNQKVAGPTSIPVTIFLRARQHWCFSKTYDHYLKPIIWGRHFPWISKNCLGFSNSQKKKTLSLLAATALYLYYLCLVKSLKKLCIMEFIVFSVNINKSIWFSFKSLNGTCTY